MLKSILIGNMRICDWYEMFFCDSYFISAKTGSKKSVFLLPSTIKMNVLIVD